VSGETIAWLVAAVWLLGFVLGGLAAWRMMRTDAPAAGSPQDVAVVDAIATAGAPAEKAAIEAAAEILHAPDSVVDARIDQLMQRGKRGK